MPATMTPREILALIKTLKPELTLAGLEPKAYKEGTSVVQLVSGEWMDCRVQKGRIWRTFAPSFEDIIAFKASPRDYFFNAYVEKEKLSEWAAIRNEDLLAVMRQQKAAGKLRTSENSMVGGRRFVIVDWDDCPTRLPAARRLTPKPKPPTPEPDFNPFLQG